MKPQRSSSPSKVKVSPPRYLNFVWTSVVNEKLCSFLSFPFRAVSPFATPGACQPAPSSGKKYWLLKVMTLCPGVAWKKK